MAWHMTQKGGSLPPHAKPLQAELGPPPTPSTPELGWKDQLATDYQIHNLWETHTEILSKNICVVDNESWKPHDRRSQVPVRRLTGTWLNYKQQDSAKLLPGCIAASTRDAPSQLGPEPCGARPCW